MRWRALDPALVLKQLPRRLRAPDAASSPVGAASPRSAAYSSKGAGSPLLTLIAAGRVEHTGATIRDALRHLEGRLGFQHEDLFVLLTSAAAPRLRAQGATWIGKFGSPAWIDHVLPLLADQSLTVVTAALRAILQFDAARAPAAIATARRDTWTHYHYLAVLGQIVRNSLALDHLRGTPRNELRIPADLVWTLLDEASSGPATARFRSVCLVRVASRLPKLRHDAA